MSPLVLRILVLALIFGAVVLAIEGIVSWLRSRSGAEKSINQRLAMIASGLDRGKILSRLRRDDESALYDGNSFIGRLALSAIAQLHASGTGWSLRTVATACGGAFAGLTMITLILAVVAGYAASVGVVLMLMTFSAAMSVGIPMLILSRLSQRRRKKMEDQFPVALDTFVRGLRAGHPVGAALNLLTTEMKDPIGTEFGIVVDETNYGAELRDALLRMADRWKMNELHMFVVSLSVQSETGGNLAEILENLSSVVRERQSLFLKVRALSSEGRMTAILLTALPIVAFIGLFLTNPRFYLDVADDPAFIIGFSSLVLLYFTGFFTIRRMVDIKV